MENNIIEIAKDVRRKCEQYAKSGRSYPKHYNDQLDLRCMCATASACLYEAFQKASISSTFCNGHFNLGADNEDITVINHCWIEKEGYIIDITATQFGIDNSVYVITDNASKYLKTNEIPSWQTMEWQWNQKPTPAIVNEILGTKISNQTISESFERIHNIFKEIIN